MKYLKVLLALNFPILSLLPISVSASGNVTTNTGASNNQLIGTVLMGAGVLIILFAIVIILNKLKGGNKEEVVTANPAAGQTPGEVLPESLNEVPKPEVVPPVDGLEKVTTSSATNEVNLTSSQLQPSSTEDTAAMENLPKVPLSELTGDTVKEEKSYSLEDIQKGEGTPQ